jgi:protein-S-isoprenylcysteine O-methyltransferase Ste14
MGWRLGKAVLALPGVVLVLVPGVILWATCGTDAAAHLPGPADPGLWVGAVFGLGGLALAIWTVRLFVAGGEGTPAPWDPPHKLVVRGPYRHVRNPMISGVLFMLLAEALILDSWPIAVWLGIFFLANAIYIPRVEEPGLEARFGEDYRRYRAAVPRWFPNPVAWTPEGDPGSNAGRNTDRNANRSANRNEEDRP